MKGAATGIGIGILGVGLGFTLASFLHQDASGKVMVDAISFESEPYFAGTFLPRSITETSVPIRNPWPEEIEVSSVSGTCGCTIPGTELLVIPPLGVGALPVRIHTKDIVDSRLVALRGHVTGRGRKGEMVELGSLYFKVGNSEKPILHIVGAGMGATPEGLLELLVDIPKDLCPEVVLPEEISARGGHWADFRTDFVEEIALCVNISETLPRNQLL